MTDSERLDWIERRGAKVSCLGPKDITESLFDDVWRVDCGILMKAVDGKPETQELVWERVGLRAAIDAAMREEG